MYSPHSFLYFQQYTQQCTLCCLFFQRLTMCMFYGLFLQRIPISNNVQLHRVSNIKEEMLKMLWFERDIQEDKRNQSYFNPWSFTIILIAPFPTMRCSRNLIVTIWITVVLVILEVIVHRLDTTCYIKDLFIFQSSIKAMTRILYIRVIWVLMYP